MFDGWTDRYKARPYLGVHASFLNNWSFTVVTLGCHVLPSHTSPAVAVHVLSLLESFSLEPKKLHITSCHDGAANMVKTSKLLKVENYQHCATHALHLLLTSDSVNQFEDVKEIIEKCRNLVTALHFKTHTIEDERAASEVKKVVDNLHEKMAHASNLLDLDDQFLATLPDVNEGQRDASTTPCFIKSGPLCIFSITFYLVGHDHDFQRVFKS